MTEILRVVCVFLVLGIRLKFFTLSYIQLFYIFSHIILNFDTGSHYVAHPEIETVILFPQPPQSDTITDVDHQAQLRWKFHNQSSIP